jgi:hypothetical protein
MAEMRRRTVDGAGELADEAAARLSDAIEWGMDFGSGARCSARAAGAMVKPQMPGVLGPLDLALEKWRAAWAGLARADRQPLGYFLLQPLAAPARRATLANAERLARPGQPAWRSRSNSASSTVGRAARAEQERPAAEPTALAHRVQVGRVKQAAADPRLQLRLEAVRRLLAGEPAGRTAA